MIIDFFKYAELVETLNDWGKAYAIGNPVVSDFVYDEEYKKLKLFELHNMDMIDKDSPTQKIASDSVDGFQKVAHEIAMISIANSNGIDELESWAIAKQKYLPFTLEFKIDGLALSLKYDKGMLTDAITRGDGAKGDRVLANALRIANIPKTIPILNKVEIRGEVVWCKDDFQVYQDYLESIGKPLMSNPRNGASGTMKSKDPQDVADRKLTFIAYSFVDGSENNLHSEDLNQLGEMGFTVSENYICPNVDKLIAGAKYMQAKKESLPYLIDGEVIKVNDKNLYEELGGTSKAPHWCTAFKFPAEEKETILLDIEESYGRSGACTPVGIVQEVELALTKVNRVSLHNWDIVEYLGLSKGCKVIIRKAGEIIPEIVKCVDTKKNKDDYGRQGSQSGSPIWKDIPFDSYKRPMRCKHCDTTMQNEQNRKGEFLIAWVCPNSFCSAKQLRSIIRFVEKDAMNIVGVGESMIESLLASGLIKNVRDLYSLSKEDLLKLDGVKSRMAELTLNAIEKSESNYMNQLLVGLGIPNMGRTASAAISDHFGTLEALIESGKTGMSKIPGVGTEIVESFTDYLNTGGLQTIQWFIDNQIAHKAKPSIKVSNELAGLIFIMTGKFAELDRDEFKKIVVRYGGKVSSGITSKVDYVLVGEGAGPAKISDIAHLKSEGAKIKELNVKEFWEVIKEKGIQIQ